MSILTIAQKKRRLHHHFLLGVVLCLAFTLAMVNVFGGNALAGSLGDVVTQVSNANLGSPEFSFGEEQATGYGFEIHASVGELGSGGCQLSVLGPAQPDEIKIMIDHVDSISQVSYMQTTQLKGCEVREYATEYGVGIGVVLPDYFITVETMNTGQSQSADIASTKSIAQQTIDAMEKAGLLSQAAPDIEAGTADTEEQPAVDPVPGSAVPETYPMENSHSPAGVGSVGNIPGPSNTTEAVTGVVVPGLIATALGALGGLGGGGFTPPAGGTPMYPTGGGSLPGAGGIPGTSSGTPGMAQATSQFGRRGREEILIDTRDMYQGSVEQGAPADHGIIIDTDAMLGDIFVPPEPFISDPGPEIFIDTIDMNPIEVRQGGGDPHILIDTVDMLEGQLVQPEPPSIDPGSEIFIDTIDMNEQLIDIQQARGEPHILIDTTDMFEGPAGSGAPGDQGIFIETEDEAALFVKGIADREMEIEQIKFKAVDTREGEAGGAHFAVAGSSDGAPIADQTEKLYTDSSDAEVLRDHSSLEDSAGTETAPGHEGAYDQNGFDADGYDREGFDQAGYDREGYNRDGFNEAGYNSEGFDKEGFDQAGFDAEGFDKEGFDQAGFDAEGFDKEGYNQEGFNKEGYDKAGYDKEGFDREGRNSSDYDRDGFNSQGYDRDGFDKNGFDKDGFNRDGFNAHGFDRDGFDANGFDAEGFDRAGFNAEGFDKAGFDKEGFDKAGFNAQGFDKEGFDKAGFDKEGFDKAGYDTEGFNRQGYNQQGFDREGFNKAGFDAEGYDRQGFDQAGFDREGFNKEGFDKAGFNREGFNKAGFDQEGFDKNGFNAEGYDREGFDQAGFDKTGYDREGFNKEGFDKTGFDKEGFDKDGFNAQGFDREGFDKAGFDQEGFDRQGFDREGLDREGFNRAGFDTEGYDREGFNKEGFDREGYGRNGFDPEGFDREGYDINGYDRQGFNRQGFDAKGFDKQGFDKEGFNKDGWDREGYDRNGFDKNGWDRGGFDKNGYDAEGYDRDGYNREGQSKEGYDADGYDKNGFNKHGYDRDGYDRDGFDFEGYNRTGRDPWGYDKQGYGKDGYHWSGYNADGYDRAGRHWTENPYEEGSIWNVDTRDPFDGGIVDLGGRREAWEPTKPPLGEPYHRTVDKYGAKPWTDEIPKTEPSTSGSGVIGQDFEETLKNHDVGDGRPDVQDGSGMSIPKEDTPQSDWPGTEPEERFPGDQIPETQPGNTFDYTDPETGVTSTYEYEPGYTGPRHGDQQTLVGTGDGQTYEIEYNAVTGKWVNTETGNDFDPDRFESWQQDFAEDKRRADIDLEKLANREDATSQAIDKNLEDWRKLEQMQKVADKYNIGDPGGPGDVDKAIQQLKDDMLAGKELDQEKMDKIRRVIDNRILGKTVDDTGQRWEEDWFKELGWALEANAATAKEVITGEKADGSTSWLGMGARIMITTATGGAAGVALDGAMNVAEALYRIKDEIDKGESDFRAVGKAIGLYVLGEQMGWLAGEGGGKVMGEMMERYPAFTNKTADFLETAILKAGAKNQMWSEALGMISKESAEESLDQINKRLVDIGSDKAAKEIVESARMDYGLKSVADSFDDVTKGAGKTVGDTTGDMTGRVAKSASEGWTDVGESGGRAATSSTDDIARGGGKAATSSSDDIARGGGKAATSSSDDIARGGGGKVASQADVDGVPGTGKAAPQADADRVPGTGKAASQADVDGVQVSRNTGDDISDAPAKFAADGDVPGEPPGRPPGGGDDMPGEPDHLPLNRGGRTPDEVLADPAALNRAERTVQENIKDFDNLPPARREDLIREQAIYDEYKMQAEERAWNLADKVQRGEPLTVEEIMEMKADPASMRTLKNLEEMDGLGSQLTPQESQAIQREFNRAMDEGIHQPSYRAVEDHLHGRYPGADPEGIRVRTVRTPGTEPTDFNINTDNDVIAERLVHGPQGPEWVEIPKAEWEDTYYRAFAENSGFSPDEAARRFPETDWANMDEAAQVRQWTKHHEEAAMDQFDLSAGRDFSTQRTWRIPDGDMRGRPMIELTEDELARGVDYVTIDGKPMRPSTGYELTQRGQGTMLDPEQLSWMEQKKFDDYWNSGDTPAQVMRNQTEAMEQLRKTANVAETVEQSYRDMGYRVEPMPDNMKQAIAVIKDNSLSPAARAARLQELGYSSPGDFLNKVSSRIGAIRTALK
ncbi:MAG: hypothetical protein GX176_08995 [Syntrophomonadaceae bacterium]|nr:hypothetical protein [Syntrophomonadaceae bacterium]